ncbi:MAG: type I restriction enzyme HsdR N-terminal domain-containing protein [Bacteroidota bacterium]
MSSLAEGCFPRVRYHKGKKMLWDPIWKRMLEVRPEERVRQQWIELLLSSGWSRNRISTELPVEDPSAKGKLRADLLCYDAQLEPQLLIECKAPEVTLRQLTGEQAARYNQHIGAPFILLTNGRDDRWYQMNDSGQQNGILEIEYTNVLTPQYPHQQENYWVEHGFLSSSTTALTEQWKRWLSIWRSPNAHSRWQYLYFPQLDGALPQGHYYCVYTDGEYRWAWSLVRGFDDSTNLVVAWNSDHQLRGILQLRWLAMESSEPEAQLIFPDQAIGVNDSDHLHLISQWQKASELNDFAEGLRTIFEQYQTTG